VERDIDTGLQQRPYLIELRATKKRVHQLRRRMLGLTRTLSISHKRT
jgi:hypothetical protein